MLQLGQIPVHLAPLKDPFSLETNGLNFKDGFVIIFNTLFGLIYLE
jgi:hypothetical protein